MPYVALLVIVGTCGAFLITRDLSSRARSALNQQLLQSSLRARALLHEDELYLLESANLAANLDGMSAAISKRDSKATTDILNSVLALKDDLHLVAATLGDGTGLVEFNRETPESKPQSGSATRWSGNPFVDSALADATGAKSAGFLTLADHRALAIAAPICSQRETCSSVGVAIVAMRLDSLAKQAAGSSQKGAPASLTIFDIDGGVLATTGQVPGKPTPVRISGDRLVRRTEQVGKTETHTLYAPFEVQGRPVGMIAVSLPSGPAFASVRGAAVRLVAILFVALAGIVGVGALLSRFILAQTRPLLATNRALGQGDLSARAPVVSDDEIGELALGLNQMAEQLQASYETLEMRVTQRTDEVQRLLRERTEFFASLSHELRTPIALIISHAEMLLDPDFPKRGRSLEERGRVMLDSGKQLLEVVNDILDLARLEAGSIHVEISDVWMQQVFTGTESILRGLASAAGITLRIDVPPDLPSVRADVQRLREVIVNLVDNAVKYTPSAGLVTITAFADPEHVSFKVSDTGVGIPAAATEHVFEPFFRATGTNTQRGEYSTGLGLALSKRLIEAQSGTIDFESEPEVGTVFTVTLPRGTAKAENRRMERKARPTKPVRSATGGDRRTLAKSGGS